jgi:hypothetical protein
LAQFARLGVVYAEDILGRDNPACRPAQQRRRSREGQRRRKGSASALQSAGINFVGTSRPRFTVGACDRGPIDVVVCDGFVGNVVLKFYEAIAPFIIRLLKDSGLDERTMMKALKQLDYSEHGGAPLLGVNGVSIISHGKSSPRAIKNAIKVAVQAIETQMDEHIGRRLQEGALQPNVTLRGKSSHEAFPSPTSPAPGRGLPSTVMTNFDFAAIGIDTTDEWIVERTGIKQRHVAKTESATDLAAAASRKAMEKAGVQPGELDIIVLGTASPDRLLPSAAVDLQASLGASRAAAFDVGAACSGFIYSATVAEGMMAAGNADTALIVGVEKLSAITDWTDRATCVLFGDGAGRCCPQEIEAA